MGSLKFLVFTNRSFRPPPLFSSSPSMCSALLLFCHRRRALPLAAALPPSPLHLLLLLLPRVVFPNPGSVSPPCCPFPCAQRHPEPSAGRHVVTATFCAHAYLLFSPLLFNITRRSQRRRLRLFPLHRAHPELQTPPPPLFLSGEPRVTVGSSHRPPIAPASSSASFPDLYSCSLAPSRLPISTGAPSPMTTIRRRLLLTVGSSLRAFARHHNPSASTTSTP
jgi:hypothetical protein